MREIKFEYGFTNHKPIRLTLTEIEDVILLSPDPGDIKYRRQYTGVKGEDGVEIYEGDVVSGLRAGRRDIGEVIFSERAAKFCVRGYKKGTYGKYIPITVSLIGTKVIGNIYENPELLDGL